MMQRGFQSVERLLKNLWFQLAFPKCYGMPPQVPELNASFEITFLVFQNFILPKLGVCFGYYKVFAILMTVPEAPIDEDSGSVFLENNIGRSREILDIEPVSESTGKQKSSHKKFWLGVLAFYALHTFPSLLWIHPVCHEVKVDKITEGCLFYDTEL